MWILVKLVIFVIKLTLLQITHILQYLITFYQNKHKYYNIWHIWRDGPVSGGPKNFPGNNMGCDHILWCREIWDREPISWWREMWALPARHKKFWAKVQSTWMDFWIKIWVLNELDPKFVLSLRKIYWDGVSWPIKLCHVANIQSWLLYIFSFIIKGWSQNHVFNLI